MREDDADGVARSERDDRVDPDPGEVGAEDRAALDAHVRVRGGEDVPPGHARARELPELREDGEEERQRMNRRELVEERVDPVEDADEHASQLYPQFASAAGN